MYTQQTSTSELDHKLAQLKQEIQSEKRKSHTPRYPASLKERCVEWLLNANRGTFWAAQQLSLSPITVNSWLNRYAVGRKRPTARVLQVVPQRSENEVVLGAEIHALDKENSVPRFHQTQKLIEVRIGARVILVMSLEQLDIAFLKRLAEI